MGDISKNIILQFFINLFEIFKNLFCYCKCCKCCESECTNNHDIQMEIKEK